MSNLKKGPLRNLLLAGVAVAAIVASSSVMAADLGMQPVYKAAPAPLALPVNWTGFYVGAHLGGAWGTKDLLDPFSGKSFASAGVNGFLGGGQIGYNYQMGWVVLGVEGDLSAADITGSAPLSVGADTFSSKTDWLATATGRIGGTVDHALLYVMGGAAWAHDKYCVSGPDCEAGDETRFGWVFGGGVEYAFTPNWSGKLEYNYMDFGTKTVDFCFSGGPCDPGDVRQRIHAVKVGVNYKFDWGR